MCTGVWGLLKDIQDPELKGLVTSLKSTVLTSRAPATTSKYLCAFLRWKHWAEAHREVAVFPVKGTEFALYLQHLGDTTGSKSAVEEAAPTGRLSVHVRFTFCAYGVGWSPA